MNLVTRQRPRLPGFGPHPRALPHADPQRPAANPRQSAGIAAVVARVVAPQRRKTSVP